MDFKGNAGIGRENDRDALLARNEVMGLRNDERAKYNFRLNPVWCMTPRIVENTIKRNHDDPVLFRINPAVFMIDHVWPRMLRIFQNTILNDSGDPMLPRINPVISMIDHDLHRMLRIVENTIMGDFEDSEQSMINPAVLTRFLFRLNAYPII